jgi:hypothetical protein
VVRGRAERFLRNEANLRVFTKRTQSLVSPEGEACLAPTDFGTADPQKELVFDFQSASGLSLRQRAVFAERTNYVMRNGFVL